MLSLKAGVLIKNLWMPGAGGWLALLQSPVTVLLKLTRQTALHLSTTQQTEDTSWKEPELPDTRFLG